MSVATPITDAAALRLRQTGEYPFEVVSVEDMRQLELRLEELTTWRSESDEALPEDAAIDAAHPMVTGVHDYYPVALRLVGARRSKYGLVNLVNWLLTRIDAAESAKVTALTKDRDRWKHAHDNQVKLKRMLTDRPGLKERAASMQKLLAELKQAKARIEELEAGRP